MANLFAYTKDGVAFPAYISVNEDDTGAVIISVRGEAGRMLCGAVGEGAYAQIRLPRAVWEQMKQ